MTFSSSRRKIFFASAAAIVCLSVGLGAGLPAIANASPTVAASTSSVPSSTSSSTDLWTAAQTSPLQEPANKLDPNYLSVQSVANGGAGVTLADGTIGKVGTVTWITNTPASGGAPVLTSTADAPVGTGAPGLGADQYPQFGIYASAILQKIVYVAPGSVVGNQSLNLLTDPGFTAMASSLGLTGAVYIPAADRVTSTLTQSFAGTPLLVSGSQNGDVSFAGAQVVGQGALGFGSNVMAFTADGNQVLLSVNYELIPTVDAPPAAPAAPTVTSLDPNHGPTAGGNPVAITGTNLNPTACTVTFDGIPASITGGTATVLNVTAPAHSAGLVGVVVTCSGLTAAPVGYTYEAPIVPPAPGPTPPVVSDPVAPVVPAPKPVAPPVPAPKAVPVVSG